MLACMSTTTAGKRELRGLAWWLLERPLALPLYAITRIVVSSSNVYRTGPGAKVLGPAIYVSWHADLPLLVDHFGARHACMMISGAPYMRPIRRLCSRLGMRLVVGTSGAGGQAALEALAVRLREGADVYLSVDGPAGPAFRVKPGCVRLAKETGRPIVPVAVRSRRPLPLPGRWDGMVLHLPCNALEVVHAPPLHVSAEDDEGRALTRVQRALDDTFARAHGTPKSSLAFVDSTRSSDLSSSPIRRSRRSSRSQA